MSIVHKHLRGRIFDISNQVLLSLVTGELLPFMEELGTPKVADSNVSIVADEHISRFDIMVDDA